MPGTNPYNPGTPENSFTHGVRSKLLYRPQGTPEGTEPVEFGIESMSIDDKVETDDITNSLSDGSKVILDGIHSLTGNIVFVYDSLNDPIVDLPFKPRTYVYLHARPDGITETSFAALISGMSYSIGPKAGTVRITASYESTGPITYPTTSQTTAPPPLN